MKNCISKRIKMGLCLSIPDGVSFLLSRASLPFNLESFYFRLMCAVQCESLLGCVCKWIWLRRWPKLSARDLSDNTFEAWESQLWPHVNLKAIKTNSTARDAGRILTCTLPPGMKKEIVECQKKSEEGRRRLFPPPEILWRVARQDIWRKIIMIVSPLREKRQQPGNLIVITACGNRNCIVVQRI